MAKRLIYERLAMFAKPGQFDSGSTEGSADGRPESEAITGDDGLKPNRLAGIKPGPLSNSIPGFIHFGKNYSAESIRQLVVESAVKKVINAQEVLAFENKQQLRNELLDLVVGNLAAFHYGNSVGAWNWDALAKSLKKEEPKPESTEEVFAGVPGSW